MKALQDTPRAACLLHPLAVDVDFARGVLVRPGALRERPGGLPASPDLRAMDIVLNAVRFANAESRELGRRLVHQRQLLLFFKVVYRSDEVREELVSMLVDPLTEAADAVPPLAGALDIELDGDVGWHPYTLKRLYRRACDHLRAGLAARSRMYEREARLRLQRDVRRLDDYYEGLRDEALEPLVKELNRLQAYRNRARLLRSLGRCCGTTGPGDDDANWRREVQSIETRMRETLASLAADRQRRLKELEAKYRVRAEVELVAAASVWSPRVELQVKLLGPARRELTFVYDPIRRRCLDLDCESCGAPMKTVYLCEAGDLACTACYAPCARCGRAMCRSCRHERCHVCDAPLCGRCDTRCPLPFALAGGPAAEAAAAFAATGHVCPACRASTCTACAAGTGFCAG